ncbi:MAG: prepilin peptidase [Chloroflexota bacterium]|jgi:leader peptidase (prepilin peptidase)/N-methyltransferase
MSMIVVWGVVGIVVGWLAHVLAGYLPRWTGHVKSPARERVALASPAVVRLATLSRARQNTRQTAFLRALAAELGSALFLAALWGVYGASQEFWALSLSYVYLLLVALVDLQYRLVLNVMIYPAILAALGGHLAAADQPLSHVLVGGGMAFSIFFLTAWLKPGQLGLGDVKLATLIGVTVGFPAILWALILGTGAAGLVTVWLLAGKGASLKTKLPYAPFLCLGAMGALLYTPVFMLG